MLLPMWPKSCDCMVVRIVPRRASWTLCCLSINQWRLLCRQETQDEAARVPTARPSCAVLQCLCAWPMDTPICQFQDLLREACNLAAQGFQAAKKPGTSAQAPKRHKTANFLKAALHEVLAKRQLGGGGLGAVCRDGKLSNAGRRPAHGLRAPGHLLAAGGAPFCALW